MKYIKSCLIITMLLGIGYSTCQNYPDHVGNDCGGGQICGACCDSEAGDIVFCDALQDFVDDHPGFSKGARQ